MLVALVLGVGILVLLVAQPRRGHYYLPLVCGYCARATTAILASAGHPIPDAHADAAVFADIAMRMASLSWEAFLGEFQAAGDHLYPWSLGLLVRLFGGDAYSIGAIVSVFFGVGIIDIAARLARDIAGGREALAVAWSVALFPTLVLYSSLPLREAPFAFLFALGLRCMLHAVRGRSTSYMLCAALCFLGATCIHSGGVVALILMLLIAVHGRGLRPGTRLGAAVFGSGILVFVLVTGAGLDKIGGVDNLTTDWIAQAQRNRAEARAVYLEGMEPSGPLDYTWQVPVRALFFLATPFPWKIRSGGDVLGGLDAVCYVGAVIVLFVRRRVLLRSRSLSLLGLFGAVLIMVFGMGTSNYGAAIRHRAKVAPVMIALLVASGVPRKRGETKLPQMSTSGGRPANPSRLRPRHLANVEIPDWPSGGQDGSGR